MEKVQEFVVKYKFLLLAILVFLLITLIFLLIAQKPQGSTTQNLRNDQKLQLSQPTVGLDSNQQAGNVSQSVPFIYFTQKSTDSSVDVYKSDIVDTTFITKLSSDVRSVTAMKNGDLLYVANLGFLDRGERINRYSNVSRTGSTVVSASAGFQIENYILSEKEDAVVFWEVEINKTTGGKSHVVYQSLTDPANRTTLVDEPLSDQTKYPVLWLSARNSVVLDSYSVNRKGLYQGLFEVNIDSLQVRQILPVDAYSQVPLAANQGKNLIYTAYNPSSAVQIPTPAVPNGLLRAVVRNPNEVRMLDVASGQMQNLISNEDGTLYGDLLLSGDGSKLILKRFSIEDRTSKPKDTQVLDLSSRMLSTFINRPDMQVIVSYQDKYIIGQGTGTLVSIGGVGSSYSQLYNGVYLFDPGANDYQKILSDDDINIIGVK